MYKPPGATAMLRGGLALLALTLVVWCYRVAKLLSFVTGSSIHVGAEYSAFGERTPNFVIAYVRGGSYQILPGVVVLCLVLTVTAAMFLRWAEKGGAVAWRAHPRIPFRRIAWVLVGLFLTEIVLRGFLALWSVVLWLVSPS
jgi:hypothetical protein